MVILIVLFYVHLVALIIVGAKIVLSLENRITQLEKLIQENNLETNTSPNVEDSVASGLVKGLLAIRDEDARHLKLLELSRKLQNQPLPIMTNSLKPKSFDTGGDLIPTNLTKEEQEVLEMFYERKP